MNPLLLERKSRSIVYKCFEEFRTNGWIDSNGGGIALLTGEPNRQYFNYLPSDYISQWPTENDVKKMFKTTPLSHTDLCAGAFPWPNGLANMTAVVHTHSVSAKSVSKTDGGFIGLTAGRKTKGIYDRMKGNYYTNEDVIEIPVIEDNVVDYRKLIENMGKAFTRRPKSCSVLVKDHGLFVFGRTWAEAKRECEVLEALFKEIVNN